MKANKLEKTFQADLVKDLRDLFPGCVILHNDAALLQGIPDLVVLYREHWVALECKAARDSDKQPNQDYYIDMLDDMSFAAFIFPENKEEVLDALHNTFGARR